MVASIHHDKPPAAASQMDAINGSESRGNGEYVGVISSIPANHATTMQDPRTGSIDGAAPKSAVWYAAPPSQGGDRSPLIRRWYKSVSVGHKNVPEMPPTPTQIRTPTDPIPLAITANATAATIKLNNSAQKRKSASLRWNETIHATGL